MADAPPSRLLAAVAAPDMLQLTKRTEYGLIALVHIAERGVAARGAEFVSVREICDRYPIPRRLVAEVLKVLQKHAIVESQRGAAGGYSLARRPDDITLGQIVAALEGAPELTSCESPIVLKSGGCEVHSTCPIRSPVHRVREQLWGLLEHTTLRSLLPTHRSLSDFTALPTSGAAHPITRAL